MCFVLLSFDSQYYGTLPMQRYCNFWHVCTLPMVVMMLNEFLKLAKSIVSLHPHQTAQAQHQLSSRCTLYTPLLMGSRQHQRRPLSVALNFHAKRRSPQPAGELNISNYTILNTFKFHSRRTSQLATCPDMLNELSLVNSMFTENQLKIWTHFPTSNMLEKVQNPSLKQCHYLCGRWTNTRVPVLRWVITSLSHGNVTLSSALWWTYEAILTTCLRLVKSTNISSVGSRSWGWRCSMAT